MKVYIGGCTCYRVVGGQVEIGQTCGVLPAEDSNSVITALIFECRQKFPITAGWRNHSAQVIEMPSDVMRAIHDLYVQQEPFTDSDFEAFSLESECKNQKEIIHVKPKSEGS